MSRSISPAPSQLALAETIDEPGSRATWIGPLVALGARLMRYSQQEKDRQLIAVISVPARDFAAALIGCGWVMTHPTPQDRLPVGELRAVKSGTPIRVVTSGEVLSDYFYGYDDTSARPRVHVGGTHWNAESIHAFAVLPKLTRPARGQRPVPGSVCNLAGLRDTWDQRLARPATDLAIVGTLKWLHADFSAYLSHHGEDHLPPDQIAALLLPESEGAATWSTRIYPSASLAETLPLPKEIDAVILDGSNAIKYLTEIENPVVICVLDRSASDETAAEIIMQLRNTRGEPFSLRDDLKWTPPVGVEALAFTVAL